MDGERKNTRVRTIVSETLVFFLSPNIQKKKKHKCSFFSVDYSSVNFLLATSATPDAVIIATKAPANSIPVFGDVFEWSP